MEVNVLAFSTVGSKSYATLVKVRIFLKMFSCKHIFKYKRKMYERLTIVSAYK